MNPKNPKEYEEHEETLEKNHRPRKLRRRKFPRDRSFVGKQIKVAEKKATRKGEKKEAAQQIEKRLEHFPDFKTHEGKRQIKMYARWVKDSLEQKYPLLDEGDIEFKTAVASVKAGGQQRQKSRTSVRATHLPTLISVRNEEERTLEQNKENARRNLFYKLENHLKSWKILISGSSFQLVSAQYLSM